MAAFGVINPDEGVVGDGGSLDSLRIILQENDRLKTELKIMMDVTVKERQGFEASQRDSLREKNGIISRQY